MTDQPADKPAWESFFDQHAPLYDDNVFTKNTAAEIEFLLEELSLPAGAAILDVGCGTGRHAVELAKRGYSVTGLDLSSGMLAEAAKRAESAGVEAQWIQADASRFSLPEQFDAALGLCEGGLGLLAQGDDPIDQPLAVLGNVSRCLKRRAKVIFTVLNVGRLFRLYQNDDVAAGRFDPFALVESSEFPPFEGAAPLPTRERAFVATELGLLFRLAGLTVENTWGGTAGNWRRGPLDLDEYELMVVAQKTGEPTGL